MGQKTVLIIAGNDSRALYSSFSVDKEKVICVHSRESLNFIRNHSTDIIILDCERDPIRGLELLVSIKEASYDVPVIFLTDIRSYEVAVNAYKLGVRDYFKKPVLNEELYRVTKDLLTIRSTSVENRRPLPCVNSHVNYMAKINMTQDVPENIARLVFYIENNPSQIKNLNQLAERANISKYHFARTFKGLTGLSPMEFVRIMKMRKAKDLLKTPDLSVTAVAEETGHSDLRNFERHFRQHTGTTPSAYRKSFLES